MKIVIGTFWGGQIGWKVNSMRGGVILWCWLLALPGWALDPERAIWHYGYSSWLDKDGLPENTVQAIAQTADGYLWAGTEAGLVRFNGRAFQVFQLSNTPEMRSDSVLSLLPDREGGLWVGTRMGLLYYRDGVFRRFREGFSNETIRCLVWGAEGAMWIGTNGGFALWDAKAQKPGRFWTVADGLADSGVRALLWREGTLWVGTAQGLSQWRDGQVRRPEGEMPRDTVRAILADREGSVWVGMEASGLFRWRGQKWERFSRREGLTSDSIRALAQDRDESLWIATVGGGLNRWRAGRFDAMSRAEGLASDHLRALYEDREGNLWVGSEAGGLAQLKDGRALTYSFADGLRSDFMRAVRGDAKGNLWAGTEGGGLHRLRADGRWEAVGELGIPDAFVTALCPDRRGNLWVGTEGNGAFRLGPGGRKRYSTAEGVAENSVWAIEEDVAGAVWLGTSNGLVRVEGEKETVFRVKDGLRASSVRSLLAARDGSVWVGTRTTGLQRWRAGTFEEVRIAPELKQVAFHAFWQDERGKVWIATSRGLAIWDGENVQAVGRRHALEKETLFQVLGDGRGRLWVSGNRGIASFAVDELEAAVEGKRAFVEAARISISDGMKSSECTGDAQPAGWRDLRGDLWFPTIRGLVRIPARAKARLEPAPRVVIEEVAMNGRAVAGTAYVSPPGNRLVAVRFAALAFRAPEKVRVRYRLHGLDRDWVDAEGRSEAVYHGVPTGEYRFEVQAAGEGQEWGAPTGVALTVQPYFYETAWFYGGMVLLALAMGYGWHLSRTRRMEREFAVTLQERSRIAREIHDTLLQGFAGAALQLGSIRKKVDRDPREAGERLDRVLDQIDDCLAEARSEIGELRAVPTFEASGFVERVRREAETAAAGLPVEVSSRGECAGLTPALEKALLRIAREAAGNAARHARASRLRIAFEFGGKRVRMLAADDGVGMDEHEVKAGHYGLQGMRERAREAGGEFSLRSKPNAGTEIEVVAPLKGSG